MSNIDSFLFILYYFIFNCTLIQIQRRIYIRKIFDRIRYVAARIHVISAGKTATIDENSFLNFASNNKRTTPKNSHLSDQLKYTIGLLPSVSAAKENDRTILDGSGKSPWKKSGNHAPIDSRNAVSSQSIGTMRCSRHHEKNTGRQTYRRAGVTNDEAGNHKKIDGLPHYPRHDQRGSRCQDN